ncbi:hypothetical protein [Arthrobacter sp. 7Tela_A1]|uniref:hypothetical protein n=1 Tax=Arthrobacter sp. 7Tela_A1 TaxID=3093745 RepID=UPI003BB7D875
MTNAAGFSYERAPGIQFPRPDGWAIVESSGEDARRRASARIPRDLSAQHGPALGTCERDIAGPYATATLASTMQTAQWG